MSDTPTPRKLARKIDSPEYFEVMAAQYDAFTHQCRLFEMPRHVTDKMSEMVVHLRRAVLQLRKAKHYDH